MDEEVLTFFWNHFEKDFETLSRATQHSFDDCILVVHSVIHNMFEVKVNMPGKLRHCDYSDIKIVLYHAGMHKTMSKDVKIVNLFI